PTGMAFSADATKIAILFEARGNALLISYQIEPGKTALTQDGEHVYPAGLLPGADTHCFIGNALAWLPDGSGWLIYGQGILDSAGGSQIADLGVGGVESAHIVQPSSVELVRQVPPGGPKQITVLHLDMSKISSLIRSSSHS
ncbi:MAG TPA: hypothetical protein VKK61_07640, partial [Tepidisphaeraceae bacterium]|nr:hypothetical protein [Tepidisphaeraceae bacterium]